MRKVLVLLYFFIIATVSSFAQNDDYWVTESTQDIAYEAPLSALINKEWYRVVETRQNKKIGPAMPKSGSEKMVYVFNANGQGVVRYDTEFSVADTKLSLVLLVPMTYKRNHQSLIVDINYKLSTVSIKGNLSNISARKKAELEERKKTSLQNLRSTNNLRQEVKIVRLDDNFFVYQNSNGVIEVYISEIGIKNEEQRILVEEERKAIEKAEREAKEREAAERAKAERDSIEQAQREAEQRAYTEKIEAEKRARQMFVDSVVTEFKDCVESINLVDLGLSVLWCDRNLGAVTEEESGKRFSWGEVFPAYTKYIEAKDYKYYISTDKKYIEGLTGIQSRPNYKDIGKNIGGTDYDPSYLASNGRYRCPTDKESQELIDNCVWKYDKKSNCFIITGPNGNSIKFPCDVTKSIEYWTGTFDDEVKEREYRKFMYEKNCAYFIDASKKVVQINSMRKHVGLFIRPVADK